MEFSLNAPEEPRAPPIIAGGRIMKVQSLSAASSLALAANPLLPIGNTSAAETPATSAPGAPLGASDAYFVSQTSLGTPFQVDSGRVAEAKGTTSGIRSYAKLMVSSHITVNNALLGILKNKAPAPPPTLLKAAYATMVSTLKHESGQALDADHCQRFRTIWLVP
jgi:predicted outer membrane protein